MALGGGMGTMATLGLHVVQGHLQHRRAVAGEGPAAQPAAVTAIVDADHLVKLLVIAEPDAVALKKSHGGWLVRGAGAPCSPYALRIPSAHGGQ